MRKLGQSSEHWGAMAGMATNAFYRDQGMSCSVLPEAGFNTLHVSGSLNPTEGIQVMEA